MNCFRATFLGHLGGILKWNGISNRWNTSRCILGETRFMVDGKIKSDGMLSKLPSRTKVRKAPEDQLPAFVFDI